MAEQKGKWVTIRGRRIFIAEGQSLEEALGSKETAASSETSAEAAKASSEGSKAQRVKSTVDKLKNAGSEDAYTQSGFIGKGVGYGSKKVAPEEIESIVDKYKGGDTEVDPADMDKVITVLVADAFTEEDAYDQAQRWGIEIDTDQYVEAYVDKWGDSPDEYQPAFRRRADKKLYGGEFDEW